MRRRWGVVLGCVLVAALVWGARRVFIPPRPMNILLITLDTTRADRLGCYGYGAAKTPTLDRLARQGVQFERAYAPVPLTLPAHASLLTGLYPPEHGLHHNGQSALPDNLPTLTTRLKAAGYETGAFIAAFVLERRFGLAREFDLYDDDLSRGLPTDEADHRYRAGETVVDAAVRWLQARTQQPFFCWVHLYDAHDPYLDHRDRFGDEFVDRPYDAELAYVDEQVGRMLKFLEESGLREQTILAVVGDHGESLGDHDERTHGMTVYNSVLRVPWIISLPGGSASGRRVGDPVSLVDFSPTMLDYLGLPLLAGVSGRSVKAAFTGESLPASEGCYAETDEPYRTGHWCPLRTLITDRWKYIRSTRPELYDLQADPTESTDLADQLPDVADGLNAQLSDWIAGMTQRAADSVSLTEQDRRILAGLGYVSGGDAAPTDARPLRDMKDMLPHFNQFDEARTLSKAGRHADAIPLLREALAADDEYFMAHGQLGLCLLQTGQIDEGIAHLRRTLELDPGADGVYNVLGYALYQRGDYREAKEVLETALRINARNHEAHYHLGLVAEKLGLIPEARDHYVRSLALDPRFAPARERLAALGR